MGTGLALANSAATLAPSRVEPRSMPEVFELANQLAKARGFVPEAYVGNPAAIAACILTGMELGLGAMQSMREVYIVKGKPSLSAVLMLGLAQRAGIKTRWIVTTNETATIGVTLAGQAEQTLSFTKADAERAKLWGQQGPWSQYPATMLRARATSAAMRAFCPGVLGGAIYESDSGETTDGVPTQQIIEGQVISAPTPEASKADDGPPIPRAVKDVADAPMLKRYCEKYGEAIVKANNAEKCVKRGEQLDVPVAHVRAWLGIPEVMPRDDYDPSEQDAPPPDGAAS